MANIKQAADDLRNIANRFKGILEVQAALEQIGDIQAATTENQNLKAKAISDYQEAKKQLEGINLKISEANEAAKAASSKAEEIAASARKRADLIIVESKNAAAAIKKDAENAVDAVNKQLAGLKSEVNRVLAKIDEKNKELDNVQSAIREAKSKITSL